MLLTSTTSDLFKQQADEEYPSAIILCILNTTSLTNYGNHATQMSIKHILMGKIDLDTANQQDHKN